jgi:hypothetical protein
MKKNKLIIIVTIIFICIILLISITTSIFINNNNKQREKGYLYIYQYYTNNYNFDFSKEKLLYDKIVFDKNTTLTLEIISIDGTGSNLLIIENGKAYITEANCFNKICMDSTISLEDNIFNMSQIVCMPNGLFIEYLAD